MVTKAKSRVLIFAAGDPIRDLMVFIMSSTWVPIPFVFTTTFISNPVQSCSNGKMAPLSRFEVSCPEMVQADPDVVALFDKIGWGSFFWRFSDKTEVTRQFALNLKDDVAQIGGFQFTIDEDHIAKAKKLPQTGEHWFKGGKVNKERWRFDYFQIILTVGRMQYVLPDVRMIAILGIGWFH